MRILFPAIISLSCLAIGCGDANSTSFRTGGDKPDESMDDTNADDTGDTGDTEIPECAPVLTKGTVNFDEYTAVGMVVEFHIPYTDPEDDLVGGVLHAELSTKGEKLMAFELSISEGAGAQAIIDEDQVVAAVEGADESKTYSYSATVTDAEGCTSNKVSGPVLPDS